MIKKYLENEALIKEILRQLNKKSLDEITPEGIAQIESIAFEYELINGEKTGLSVEDIKFFPNLKNLTLKGFCISTQDLILISEFVDINELYFIGCQFEDADFSKMNRIPKHIRFRYTKKLPEKLPSMEYIDLITCIVDFKSIDLKNARHLRIRDSIIRNVQSLESYEDLEILNIDGSKIYDEDGKEITDIKVGKKCTYTHKEKDEHPTDDKRFSLRNLKVDKELEL